MRVLHVHGKDIPEGGGAVSTYRLHSGLRGAGIDSRILCRKKTLDSSVAMPLWERPESLLGRVTGRLGLNEIHCVSSFKITKLPEFCDADIVNFHCIHGGFFSYLALPSLTKDKAAVLSLRDMWHFTGHCTFSFDCDRWKTGCGNCPYPNVPNKIQRDNTRLEWRLKNWVYRHSNFTVVTLDSRMTALAKESMLKCFPIEQIPNGVDTEAYQPLDSEQCRSLLGVPLRKKVLLFSAVHLKDRRKGGDLLVEALRTLPKSLKAEMLLLLMGQDGAEVIAGALDIPTMNLGFVGGHRSKAIIYSAADLFIFPTRAEGLPNSLLESMACGTPMVSFNVGGVPDLVRHAITGYLAEAENAEDLSKGIVQLLEDSALREFMSQRCRAIALKEYSADLEVQRHIALYQRLLRN
jgi:glycosyltransferase involved in cell wall biosynthesis